MFGSERGQPGGSVALARPVEQDLELRTIKESSLVNSPGFELEP